MVSILFNITVNRTRVAVIDKQRQLQHYDEESKYSKMEFENMVINFGIRYDYFDPASYYPSDRRNPANQLVLPDSMMSTQLAAPVIDQISPRVGFAYQLGSQAVLHFSYGHF